MRFCTEAQATLLDQPWPEQLLQLPQLPGARPVWVTCKREAMMTQTLPSPLALAAPPAIATAADAQPSPSAMSLVGGPFLGDEDLQRLYGIDGNGHGGGASAGAASPRGMAGSSNWRLRLRAAAVGATGSLLGPRGGGGGGVAAARRRRRSVLDVYGGGVPSVTAGSNNADGGSVAGGGGSGHSHKQQQQQQQVAAEAGAGGGTGGSAGGNGGGAGGRPFITQLQEVWTVVAEPLSAAPAGTVAIISAGPTEGYDVEAATSPSTRGGAIAKGSRGGGIRRTLTSDQLALGDMGAAAAALTLSRGSSCGGRSICVFRGLRVRMGMTSGVGPEDVFPSNTAGGKPEYGGRPLAAAKAVCDAAQVGARWRGGHNHQ